MNRITLANNRNVISTPNQIALSNTRENFTTLSGPLQGCEDSVCSHCDYRQGNYKECKQKCFEEKAQEIQDCCRRMCGVGEEGGLPSKYAQDCLESCTQPMVFGPQQQMRTNMAASCSIM